MSRLETPTGTKWEPFVPVGSSNRNKRVRGPFVPVGTTNVKDCFIWSPPTISTIAASPTSWTLLPHPRIRSRRMTNPWQPPSPPSPYMPSQGFRWTTPCAFRCPSTGAAWWPYSTPAPPITTVAPTRQQTSVSVFDTMSDSDTPSTRRRYVSVEYRQIQL